MSKEYKIFANGSTWLRVDFHLHTNVRDRDNVVALIYTQMSHVAFTYTFV